MASNHIVQIAVTQVAAPIPEELQQSGALVSVGSTILAPGASATLTQLADLTPLLRGAQTLLSITYNVGANTATATTITPHGFDVGDVLQLTIAGAVPTAYNGVYQCEITGASTFIYQPSANPGGSASTPGGYTPQEVSELLAMATTFFAQGNIVACFVLELGAQQTADAITALSNYLTANPNSEYEPGEPGFYYVYLLPAEFDNQPGLLSLLTTYDGTDAEVYFVISSTLSTYTAYSDLMKDAIVVIPTPSMGLYPQVAVSSVTVGGYAVNAFQFAASQSGAGSYAPGNVLTVAGGTGTKPTFTVTDTKVMTAVVNGAGTAGTPGPVTLTGTTGTGTRFQATGTINGSGNLTGALVVTVPGDYTVNPTSIAAEPVTGGGLTGATVTLVMGVLSATLTTAGNMTAVPANPAATTVAPGPGTGATLTILWTQSGLATATMAAPHNVAVGQWFQLSGFTPIAWNGWWQAGTGTAGSTLTFAVPAAMAAVVTPGFLVQNTASSAGPGATEFQAAAVFYDIVSSNPSPTNRVAPFSFRFQFGVTPWPRQGLSALQLNLKTASVNIIKTGAEGGISTATLFWGTTKDGRGILYWYSVDWMSINGRVNVANAVINGSNDPTNPLYYSQAGIDRLQDVLAGTVGSAVSNGLALGRIVKTALTGSDLTDAINAGKFSGDLVVNAVPFLTYLTANPSDYRVGTYNGLSVRYITTQGFISILVNIAVTDFVVAG